MEIIIVIVGFFILNAWLKQRFDPTGQSRKLFKNVSSNCYNLINRGMEEKAKKLAMRFILSQRNKFGKEHPDVGRGWLLLAEMNNITGNYEYALRCCYVAIGYLSGEEGKGDPLSVPTATKLLYALEKNVKVPNLFYVGEGELWKDFERECYIGGNREMTF